MGTAVAGDDHGLEPDVVEWVCRVTDSEVVGIRRFVHPRPMWEIDVQAADGTRTDLFLRGDRGTGSVLSPVYDLEREAGVVQAVSRLGVATPGFVAYEPRLRTLLIQRVDGRSDIHLVDDPEARQQVAENLMDVLASLHAHEAADFQLDLPVPESARDHALQEVEIAERLYDAAKLPPEPTMSLGRRWLRQAVPEVVERTSLVQGDTGPGNFMFEDREVTSLVDWELAHFGDPLEDLAAVCIRDMVTPFADLGRAFEHYAKVSGTTLDLDRVRYHRVSKCVRSLVALLSYTERAAPSLEYNTWQAWKALYLRSSCQAYAEAMGIELPPEPEPIEPPDTPRSPLYEVLRSELGGAVSAGVTDRLVRLRLANGIEMLDVLARFDRIGPTIEAAELDELSALLGHPVERVDVGIAELDRRIQDGDLGDEEVLIYLSRRAARGVELFRPIMGEMADRRFSSIEP